MRHRWVRAVAVAATLVSIAGCGRPAGDAQTRADLDTVFKKYLQSLDAADVTLASQVWLQSPDVLVVTPGGRVQGWESVRDDIYITSMQKGFVERHVEASNVSVTVGGDAAWLVYDFVFTAKRPDGQALTLRGWESHGYQRTPTGWRIVQLHYSLTAPMP